VAYGLLLLNMLEQAYQFFLEGKNELACKKIHEWIKKESPIK